MTISGFTFVKNAEKFDYPVVESITSILPIVDEFIVNLGTSKDNTRGLIESIDSRQIKIIETKWDPRFTAKTRIFAVQTNIALYQCKGDWCFYIQADEVFHPDGLSTIKKILEDINDDQRFEGLLLDYVHFFGGYKWAAKSHRWYRKEVRVIRNFLGISSFRDAQGFRLDGKKLRVFDTGLKMHHYGWVRPPAVMQAKKAYHDSLYHGSNDRKDEEIFDYQNYIDPRAVEEFQGTHPPSMRGRIDKWNLDFDPKKINYTAKLKDFKYRTIDLVGRITGWFPGEYKNYRKVKR